jgi:hypothetical protein
MAVDLTAVTEASHPSGIEHGDALVAFAEAVVARDGAAIAGTRERLVAAMGAEAMVDAAAVASNFERMVRIADATGIPLDDRLESIGRPVIDQLGLERFRGGSADA